MAILEGSNLLPTLSRIFYRRAQTRRPPLQRWQPIRSQLASPFGKIVDSLTQAMTVYRPVNLLVIFALTASPSSAQHQKQHNTHNSSNDGKATQQYAPPLSQSQMADMLDQVSTGRAPTLPTHSHSSNKAATSHGMTGLGSSPGAIVRPPAGGLINRNFNSGNVHPMGMARGMSSSMGIARPPALGGSNRGMMPMSTMGGGGMAHSAMTGGGAAQFMQQFKQKFGALMPGAMGAGEQESGMGGMPGAMGGGMPGAMGGGGGMQAQLMQRLFQGQAPGGTGAGMSGFPGRAPARMQATSRNDDVIKRPPGVAGIAGGASTAPPGHSTSSSSASDLERQMEQQYGK